ncbi:hypothetical protein [Thalassospira mesophila]|uniref:Uncharacterized protein n=1 Tax=Thalassospira mesophila TaxID=1293891 RepID=A0A1Y2KWQ8_9PROT|nr:hypothetical protein [Thalassospira mesophila]OSQ36121.1 hypothetical protein TMES_18785 [Thalassospira mesophila]
MGLSSRGQEDHVQGARRHIFAAMGTQDFEEVIRALQHAAAIVSVYRPKFVSTKRLLLTDAEKLKTDLIKLGQGSLGMRAIVWFMRSAVMLCEYWRWFIHRASGRSLGIDQSSVANSAY